MLNIKIPSFIRNLTEWYFHKNALPYWCIIMVDVVLCFISGIVVFWLYNHTEETILHFGPLIKTLFIYIVVNVVCFRIYHTYSGIIRYSSFIDLKRICFALGTALILALLIHYPLNFGDKAHYFLHLNARQLISTYIVSAVALCGIRIIIKSLYDVTASNRNTRSAFIYGGGIGIAKMIRSEHPSRFSLKGFMADGEITHNMLMGVRVYTIDQHLPEILKKYKVDTVLISPLKTESFRNNTQLHNILINLGIQILIAGKATKWDRKEEGLTHLKDVSIEDLLPRDEINVDMDSVGNMLRGKTILITGSAGSIGSEMVRQIGVYSPKKMVLIDQAETPQHDIRLMMQNDFANIEAKTIVSSICSKEHMEAIFNEFRPDYVFHAAAYKHVPMMEDNPSESVRNNIYCTKVIADLSVKYGVKKFVMISTDKAVNPTNVMGCSKRICEIYVQSLDKAIKDGKVDGITQFVTTRFGNVLGSNGSVIPLFTKQIREGGPVTVTDPRIIRYFMLIPEACKLVLEAGTKGNGGEIFVFDMGKPVKIADLAQRMIYLSGAKNVKIEYTGLRAGEKLYEELLNIEETTKPSFHKKIRIAHVREYDYAQVCQHIEELFQISRKFDDMETVRKMKQIVPEYVSNNSKYDVLDYK